ncbi:MAG: type I restriction endonuclease subunit R, partial [Candidatus Methanosuratincola sp.]
MPVSLLESEVEEAAIDWFKGLGYQYLPGPDIASDGTKPERASYTDVILADRLWSALHAVNSNIPAEALEDAFKKVLRAESQSLISNNRRFHKMLVDGVDVEYRHREGRTVFDKVWLIDFTVPESNDWLVVNQFTVVEGQHTRRPDIVVFVNGLPLAVIELKNPTDEEATIKGAYYQLETYKAEIPSLFHYNELLAVSDGTEARVGTISSGWEWFLPWRTITGKTVAPQTTPELEVLIKGVFDKPRFLDIIRHFILFEVDRTKVVKKIAAYHQYHAVNAAVEATLKATSPLGDKRVGVVWHTQGAGKSLTMVFYAGKIVLQPEMANPTLVLLTDRNDLDNQLFDNFKVAQDLLRQEPVQAETREHLKELLKVASGGIIFTTIQKFLPQAGERFPLLSDRRNIVVIADEAHRSQYDFINGFARHMRDALPNASFVAFTGTPIEKADRSTPAVFGDYISIYDIQQAVLDGATVPIFYESRLAKLELSEEERPHIDPEFEEVTEGEEETVRQQLKTKWARLEAMVGTEKRIGLVARDIVDHFEQRLQAMDGKGMIVCMSRRICVDLYDAIIKLCPGWHSDDDEKGFIKVVMTGSASDPPNYQPHIRNKDRREKIKQRMKDPTDPLKLVIVRDMWLTGFDCPCLHTM